MREKDAEAHTARQEALAVEATVAALREQVEAAAGAAVAGADGSTGAEKQRTKKAKSKNRRWSCL